MFTGIISHIGKVKSFQNSQLLVKADRSLIKQVKNGDSVAVNGVCLTVIDKRADLFQVEVMPETLKRTALGGLKSGDIVNLELAMKANGLIL